MRWLWCLMLLAAAGLCAAEADSPDWQILAKQTNLQKYPDADSVLLFDRQTFRYETDGTSWETDDFFRKILTEKGVSAQRRQAIHFNTAYGKAAFVKVELLRPGKPPVNIDLQKNSSLTVNSAQMNSNIYNPNQKVLQVQIPDLQVGDTLHIVTENRISKPYIPGIWCEIVLLQDTDPILHYEVIVDAPENNPLRAKCVRDQVSGTVKFSEHKSNGRQIYRWTAENVPQFFPEPLMPSPYSCVQRLLLSTAPDWPTISRWYYNLSLPHLKAVTPAMKEKVAELTKGAKTPEEKMERLFRFVSQEIRYMGITTETTAPGYEPHDVRLTFERRYGVCRDKAALLTAMLNLAGIRAYPVLFMYGDPKDPDVPNNYFNHAITAAELEQGKYILLDPTYENSRDFLPGIETEMSYLAATPQGDTLRLSPPGNLHDNVTHVKTHAKLRYDGNTDLEIELSATGITDLYIRSTLALLPESMRRNFFAAKLKQAWAGTRLEKLIIEPQNIRDTTKPLKIRLTGTTGNEVTSSRELFILPMPQTMQAFGSLSLQIFREAGLQKRQYPLKLHACSDFSAEFSASLPEGFVPENMYTGTFSKHTPGISIMYTSALHDRTLTGRIRMQISKTRFSPEDYLEFKNLLKDAENATNSINIFRRGGTVRDPLTAFPEANAVIQKRAVNLNMYTSESGRLTEHYRFVVRNYAGVKKCSEVKIPYNPVWDAKPQVEATVTAPDGTVRTLQAEEINEMDQPWVRQAPRYPAGKILAVSFPGVKPGSTVDFTLISDFRNRTAFSFKHVFGEHAPILQDELQIHWPKDYHPQELPQPENIQRTGNVFRNSGMAEILQEPDQPALENFIPSWGFSGFTWEKWGKELQQALLEKTQNQPRAAALAKELCQGKKTEEEKILAIRNYVLHNIRLAGPAFYELPLTCLTKADRVLSDGYGNSADRAILLKTMLDAVNVPSWFVVVSSHEYTQKRLMKIANFPETDHLEAILVAAGQENPASYLNSGSQYDVPGTCPYENHLAFDLRKMKWQTLDVRQPGRDLTMQFNIVLHQDCSADIRWQQRYYGANFGKMAKWLAELTPKYQSRYIQKQLTEISQKAILTRPMATQFQRYPGTLEIDMKIPDFANKSKDFRNFELPMFAALATAINTTDSRRSTPYERKTRKRIELEYRIEFPENWQLYSEPGQIIEQDMAKITIRRKIRKNILYVLCQLELGPGEIEPWNYNDLENLQRTLQLGGIRTVLFRVLTK